MKERLISILFLSTLGLMFVATSAEYAFCDAPLTKLTLKVEWETESESEDSEKELEDVDKIILSFSYGLNNGQIIHISSNAFESFGSIHRKIHLPPPERA